MNRSTLARRYAPLVALAVLQLLIIGFVPSKAAKQGQAVSAGGGGRASAAATNAAGAGQAAPGAATGTAAGATGTGGGSVAAPPGADVGGDTTHCVNGRQYDPAIAFWAPPCVPGALGATGVDNGGGTYQGVTGDEITLVDYVSDYGAEVNAILQAEGSLVTYSDAQVLDKAWEKFINDHYQLYGRHVKIVTYQGKCQSVPPKYDCLIPEMDSIVNTYHPFAVNWQTTLCSKCYAELARLQTVAIGGTGFSDDLATALSPYFYSAGESSTQIEAQFAEFYCGQMANTPVKFAGHQNPAQDFNGKPRVLGIISTDDPDNKDTVNNFLVPKLNACGVNVDHFYFYAQDINTAAQQVAAGIAAMDTTTRPPATTVLCLCDEVAPAFLFSGEQSNNYYPENVIATDQGMDFDKTGQSYGPDPSNGGSSLGCPSPQVGCEYDLAFGLSEIGTEEPNGQDAGTRIFQAGGGTQLPGSVEGKTLVSTAKQWIMLANLMEAAGPGLTPQAMSDQAASLGGVGGPGTPNELCQFDAGGGFWTKDARLVYFDRNATSNYNGGKGAYIQVGDRLTLGNWGSAPYDQIPEKR